jgi:hypothetical protein
VHASRHCLCLPARKLRGPVAVKGIETGVPLRPTLPPQDSLDVPLGLDIFVYPSGFATWPRLEVAHTGFWAGNTPKKFNVEFSAYYHKTVDCSYREKVVVGTRQYDSLGGFGWDGTDTITITLDQTLFPAKDTTFEQLLLCEVFCDGPDGSRAIRPTVPFLYRSIACGNEAPLMVEMLDGYAYIEVVSGQEYEFMTVVGGKTVSGTRVLDSSQDSIYVMEDVYLQDLFLEFGEKACDKFF